jgi:hypothetical protein
LAQLAPLLRLHVNPRLSQLGRGCNLELVPLVVESVLDHLLDPVLVGPLDDARRDEAVQIAAVIFIELAPPEFISSRAR